MLSEKTLDEELAKAQTVQEVIDIAKQAGHEMSFEEADQFFGRIEQAKSDLGEVSGDSVAKVAREQFGSAD